MGLYVDAVSMGFLIDTVHIDVVDTVVVCTDCLLMFFITILYYC